LQTVLASTPSIGSVTRLTLAGWTATPFCVYLESPIACDKADRMAG